MVDLLVWKHPDHAPGIVEPEVPAFRWLRLYCWPCNGVHEFVLADVEQLVYALGAAEVMAYESGFADADSEEMRTRGETPACLRTILRAAENPEAFAEHVEQGVTCRERGEVAA